MTVKDLINKLKQYNPEANVHVISNWTPYDLIIEYGYSDGCTPESCEEVNLHPDVDYREERECE